MRYIKSLKKKYYSSYIQTVQINISSDYKNLWAYTQAKNS